MQKLCGGGPVQRLGRRAWPWVVADDVGGLVLAKGRTGSRGEAASAGRAAGRRGRPSGLGVATRRTRKSLWSPPEPRLTTGEAGDGDAERGTAGLGLHTAVRHTRPRGPRTAASRPCGGGLGVRAAWPLRPRSTRGVHCSFPALRPVLSLGDQMPAPGAGAGLCDRWLPAWACRPATVGMSGVAGGLPRTACLSLPIQPPAVHSQVLGHSAWGTVMRQSLLSERITSPLVDQMGW